MRPQSALAPASDQAGHLFSLWNLMLGVCGFMYLLVIIFLAWAIWRSRSKLAAAVQSPQTEVNDKGLERTFAAWAGLILGGLIVLTTASFLVDRAFATADARDALKIKLTGQQWWWKIEYQDGPVDRWIETANELHLPAGRPAELTVEAQDVIHSFWVPNLSGKIDMIPGRTNHVLITPRQQGAYRGQCAEFCGFQHAHMALDVTVEPTAAFEAWRSRQLQSAPETADPILTQGRKVFETSACVACHRIAGTEAGGETAPDLTHVAGRKSIAAGTLPYSRANLTAWIANPRKFKPGTTMPAVKLATPDLFALTAYLDSLK